MDNTGNPSNDKPDKAVSGRKSLKSILSKIGLDIIPIIAGILIALFINSWQEGRRDRKLLASTLQSLSEEFQKNTANINNYLPRQSRFLDTLRFYKLNPNLNLLDISGKASGMGTPTIFSTNWRTSLNNNSLHLLNFHTINLLSQIDAKYDELKDGESIMAPVVFGPPMFETGPEGIAQRRGMELWLESYMGNEKELLALYGEFDQILRQRNYQR